MCSKNYDPRIHHRRSLRLPDYDYSSIGAYFVTICTDKRAPHFEHAELRRILEQQWQALPQRFKGVLLDEFVIMPDHVHFILWLDAEVSGGYTLGHIVGAYKSLVKIEWNKYIKAFSLPHYTGHFWQSGYKDRVIRNDFELTQKRIYIQDNPIKRELKLDQ